ncbi:hypothetical protein FQN55_003912 [Onygenales sp. PD_40]|nr:hypothetical protein FQN55_003912 [Onygenales sp. PD_40]
MRFLAVVGTATVFLSSFASASPAPENNPTAFAKLSSLDIPGREAAYGSLSKTDQRSFWTEKLEAFKDRHLDSLQDGARLALDGAIALANSTMEITPEAGREVQVAMTEFFGWKKTRSLLATMGDGDEGDDGDDDDEAGDDDGDDDEDGDEINKRDAEERKLAKRGTCECATHSNFCGPLKTACKPSDGRCTIESTGCGIYWQTTCNGVCEWW